MISRNCFHHNLISRTFGVVSLEFELEFDRFLSLQGFKPVSMALSASISPVLKLSPSSEFTSNCEKKYKFKSIKGISIKSDRASFSKKTHYKVQSRKQLSVTAAIAEGSRRGTALTNPFNVCMVFNS